MGSDATVGIKNTVDYFIRYIKEATGAELSIAAEGEVNDYEICIGKTDRETEKVTAAREGLSRSGVAVVADGTKIFLTGYGEQGVIYSMYQFLEDYLGYRFYANDYQIAKLEYAKEFPSDLNYTYSPVFIGRDMDPMIVDLKREGASQTLVTHNGQEFNIVLEGSVIALATILAFHLGLNKGRGHEIRAC